MKDIPLKRIKINNSQIEYFHEGKGEKLLLIHGWNCSYLNYYYNIPFLIKNFEVIIPNLPGNGKSEEWNNKYSPENYAEFIKHFSTSLGITNFHVLGHSMGARIALFLTKEYPQLVDKLILMEPVLNEKRGNLSIVNFLSKNRSNDKFLKIISILKKNNIVPTIWSYYLISHALTKNKESTLITIKGMKSSSSKVFIDGLIDIIDNKESNIKLIRTIKKEITFIFGEKDPVTKPSLELINNNREKVFIIKSTKHTPNRENPKEFEQVIKNVFKIQ